MGRLMFSSLLLLHAGAYGGYAVAAGHRWMFVAAVVTLVLGAINVAYDHIFSYRTGRAEVFEEFNAFLETMALQPAHSEVTVEGRMWAEQLYRDIDWGADDDDILGALHVVAWYLGHTGSDRDAWVDDRFRAHLR